MPALVDDDEPPSSHETGPPMIEPIVETARVHWIIPTNVPWESTGADRPTTSSLGGAVCWSTPETYGRRVSCTWTKKSFAERFSPMADGSLGHRSSSFPFDWMMSKLANTG